MRGALATAIDLASPLSGAHQSKANKNYEVGLIPDDWTVVPLGRLLLIPPTYGINAPAVSLDTRMPAYIRITDITDSGNFSESSRVSVDHPLSQNYLLQPGDIVLARTGASTGKSYLYRESDGPLVYAGFLIRVRPDQKLIDPSLLRHWLATSSYWHWIQTHSMRSGQPGINGKQYSQLPIPLPPTRAEQDAIAEALSDADALIEGLESLIAKKRLIKQGAMQELLSARRRLPGFSGEWEVKPLGSLGAFAKGSGVKREDANSGNLPCVRYGELYTRHHDVIREYHSLISASVASTARRLKKGDILFAGSGETKEEIGKCASIVHGGEAYAGGDIIILRPTNDDPVFLGYYLNTPEVQMQKASRGQGDAVVHISATALGEITVRLPRPPEQAAIATVLSDMDEKIAALEQRLAKTRAIKQGMMQELLTGRIRLV